MSDTGVWLVGARGNIATTAVVGAHAVARGETDETGLVTERPPCTDLELPAVESFVFGGHDVREETVLSSARRLAERDGTPAHDVVDAVADDLDGIDDRIEPGTALNCGERVRELADGDLLEAERNVAETVERLREDLRAFRREAGLQRHLASFFKAPLGVEEHDLSRQFGLLDEYVGRHADRGGEPEPEPTPEATD